MRRSLFALGASLVAVACHRSPESEPEPRVAVHCVSPVSEAIDQVAEFYGHLEPPPGGDLPLAAQVAGRIVEVLVHEGQPVLAGDLAASVDDLASRASVRQAEASLAQASAAQLNSTGTLARARALVNRGIIARQELDDATAKAETDRQAVESARAALDLAQRTLGRVQVRVAFGGTVTHVWRGPGALVDGTAATPIAQIAAAAGAEFLADVTERDLIRIRSGQLARVQLAPDSADFAGIVRAVPSALDLATGLGTVRISLSAAPVAPMGAHGRVHIVTAHRDAVLLVPIEALRGAVADGAEVVVCAGTSAIIRTVRVGYRDDHRFEVVSGLTAAEKVATDHVLGLETGTRLVQTP